MSLPEQRCQLLGSIPSACGTHADANLKIAVDPAAVGTTLLAQGHHIQTFLTGEIFVFRSPPADVAAYGLQTSRGNFP